MTTETALATREQPALTPFEVIEKVITQGDLAKMSAGERVAFYWRTCESLGLNPLTRPFEYINLNGKLTMYARKDATDQLRKLNAVSVTEVRREKDEELGLLIVYARGRDKTGREDEATGVVAIKGLSGEALANATMKAETKAKRRLTLSLVGLGFLDESEVDGAAAVDPMTGEIVEPEKPKSLIESVRAQQAALATEPAAAPTDEAETIEGTATDVVDAPADPAWMEGAVAGEPAASEPPAEPAAAPAETDVAELIRSSAAASGMQGPATSPQLGKLKELLGGLTPAGVTTAALVAIWDEGVKTALSSAQAQALLNQAESVGVDVFTEQLRAIGAQARGAAA